MTDHTDTDTLALLVYGDRRTKRVVSQIENIIERRFLRHVRRVNGISEDDHYAIEPTMQFAETV
ncbi:hypothetical protein AAFP30_08470 [Gordonia sp. CPCC 205515]|uniref:hypothetical protein n=1 Tax=Gordonia sp. CPCC 205515 TaxID=3140791 RepID=UPI003AF3C907